MKKKLIIKLNDIIIEVAPYYNQAVKKSLEFFLGCLIKNEEIESFKKRKCPATNHDCINLFLNEKNVFIRDKAILKKFTEYYFGREFDGLIKECRLLIEKKTLEKISKKFDIILLSLMPKEETDYLIKKFDLGAINVISAANINEALKECKGSFYLGNNTSDYAAAIENELSYLGFNMKPEEIPKGTVIKTLEEL